MTIFRRAASWTPALSSRRGSCEFGRSVRLLVRRRRHDAATLPKANRDAAGSVEPPRQDDLVAILDEAARLACRQDNRLGAPRANLEEDRKSTRLNSSH